MKLILKEKSYDKALVITNLPILKNRREQLCESLFEKMQTAEHKLHSLLPEPPGLNLPLTHKGFAISISINYLKLELRDVRGNLCTMYFLITTNHF